MATPDTSVGSSDIYNRAWVSDTTGDSSIQVKPRRPYTPYNLFYLLERELVVQGHEPSDAKTKALEKARATNARNRQEDEIPIPDRYKNVVLQPMWYEPNMKEKRKHRKTHGMVRIECTLNCSSIECLSNRLTQWCFVVDFFPRPYCNNLKKLGNYRQRDQGLLHECVRLG